MLPARHWSERFAELDRNIRTLLGVNPQALIVVLWLLNPTQQWLQGESDGNADHRFQQKEESHSFRKISP